MRLRGLTLWRPWPSTIIEGPKRVENRPWAPSAASLRAEELWIAIHAGAHWDGPSVPFIRERWDGVDASKLWTTHGIVGLARVASVHRYDDMKEAWGKGCYGRWAFGPWCWLLSDVIELEGGPVPAVGRQGLWRLEERLERRLLAIIEKSGAPSGRRA